MEVTPLERLKLLVGEEAFQEAERQAAEKPQPDTGTREGWADVNEELDISTDEDLKSSKQVRKKLFRTSRGSENGSITLGDLCKPGLEFCPVIAVSRMHYKYKNKRPQGFDEANERYFAKGKFWERKWTLYYISCRFVTSPVMLVRAKEVWEFLTIINKEIGLDWGFSRTANKDGFLLSFSGDGSPRPRFLGISNSKSDFDELSKRLPREHAHDTKVISEGLANGYESTRAFRRKVEMASALSKMNGKSSKSKELRRREAKETWCRQLRRTQRYLGLRAANKAEELRAMDTIVTFEDEEEIQEAADRAKRDGSPEVDITASVPFPFNFEVVFVSVDIEAYESNHSLVTEIGVSTLDTRDIINIIPGSGGRNWMDRIRARHFRIRENSSYVNGQHVAGCPDRFEKAFGESEWINMVDVASTMASCFRHPFSTKSSSPSIPEEEIDMLRRNVILIGHNVSTDIDYLRRAGYSVKNLSTLVEVLDTANLYRALKHETQVASLATILQDLNLEAWNLHNAGNDAAYTLQALIGMAIKGLKPKEVRSSQTKQQRIEKAQLTVAEQVVKDWDEWTAASDIGEDGGSPEPWDFEKKPYLW